ncbi:hypothetical protein C2845_PM04G21110 [Panicum miliaceum]|uniref:Uncharacterized protein n=1 Tax=Panicum miliaceum TaxID=4540 RepID=A0A3L6QP09_PANMI|nr:hypothetical protein C2845_PM04G21110 [Panicum miliaceum]
MATAGDEPVGRCARLAPCARRADRTASCRSPPVMAQREGQALARSTLLCTADKAPEESLKKTIEVDRLIDMLRDANPREKDYEELAENVMNIVDRLVHKTDQKIEQSTDVLKAIISPAMHEGDVKWPPKEPDTLKLMEKEIARREQEGQLDEGFLSEVSAQLRQVKQDGDKPGLQAMLQKVLQLYASKSLQKRSYAYKGGQVVVPEKFLESVIQGLYCHTEIICLSLLPLLAIISDQYRLCNAAPENEWNKVLLDGLTVGKGDVSPDDLYAVISKRIERVLIRTEGGSYQQRILVEYLKEIQARAEEVVKRTRSRYTVAQTRSRKGRGAQEMDKRDIEPGEARVVYLYSVRVYRIQDNGDTGYTQRNTGSTRAHTNLEANGREILATATIAAPLCLTRRAVKLCHRQAPRRQNDGFGLQSSRPTPNPAASGRKEGPFCPRFWHDANGPIR